MNDLDRERVIESGKRLLSTIYEGERTPELESGNSYLLKEKNPEEGFRSCFDKMKEYGAGYCLSRNNPTKIKEMYPVDDVSISFYWLTNLKGKNKFAPDELSLISHSMINFLQEEGGIIFMDGVESILKHNSFSRFLGILDHLVDVVDVEEGVFVMSLDPRTVSERRLAQIEQKFELL